MQYIVTNNIDRLTFTDYDKALETYYAMKEDSKRVRVMSLDKGEYKLIKFYRRVN